MSEEVRDSDELNVIKLTNTDNTMILNSLPSHICSVCRNYEFEDAHIATSEFWICEDCINKLRLMLKNFNTESNNKDELPTAEEYKERLNKFVKVGLNKYSEPVYKCPKCGGKVRLNLETVCTSYPPRSKYECDNCDYIEYI